MPKKKFKFRFLQVDVTSVLQVQIQYFPVQFSKYQQMHPDRLPQNLDFLDSFDAGFVNLSNVDILTRDPRDTRFEYCAIDLFLDLLAGGSADEVLSETDRKLARQFNDPERRQWVREQYQQLCYQ